MDLRDGRLRVYTLLRLLLSNLRRHDMRSQGTHSACELIAYDYVSQHVDLPLLR